ncbi:MAG: hypothetical protein U5P41_07215 [Gammaproteobacteria bacterium]|nr:hypothetical protein [Gammaproteobacteria bacterium]
MPTTGNTRTLIRDLWRLLPAEDGTRRELEPPSRQQPIDAARGLGRARGGAGEAGIASPLTEPDAGARTLSEDAYELTSSDGLIVFEYRNILAIEMEDAQRRRRDTGVRRPRRRIISAINFK